MADDLPRAPTVPLYDQLNRLLDRDGFDDFAAKTCSEFHADKLGRPSLPPGAYFRMLLLGYLLGLDSERRIALQVRDSLSLREFLGYGLHESTPDHSTLSRTRQRISLEAHRKVFAWAVQRLQAGGLADGRTVGLDATTLEASAALRMLQRKDSGEDCDEFVQRLAEASGLETPTREELLDS